MSILGAVARLQPLHLSAVLPRLQALPGLEVALNPGDGRLVLLLEDSRIGAQLQSAQATLTDVSRWPEMLSVTLVYEYSGTESPPADDFHIADFQAWRSGKDRATAPSSAAA